MSEIKPFRIDIPQARLDHIRDRVLAYPWPQHPAAEGWTEDWSLGVDLGFLRSLCGYWAEAYDWRHWEARLNRFPQFKARVADADLHFYMERGSGPSPRPLLLIHGWPGSVFEYVEHIEPLAHPERFGGDVADAFTVIVPSLPGYAFSGPPARPIGPRQIAGRMATLMTDVLGFDRYLVQGGDWGGVIGGFMAYEAPGLAGAHLNLYGWVAQDVRLESQEERAYSALRKAVDEDGGGYSHQQRTRPQSLSVAMRDSPVGVCAWIVEKFHGWSDTRTGFENVYTRDQLLTNVMLYVATDSFHTAAWPYKGRSDERAVRMPDGGRIERPVAIANFTQEFFPMPPRSYVERGANVVQWTDFPDGGHFPALEQPQALREDLLRFARKLRSEGLY